MESVLSQTDAALEFIVVNDGSSDETPAILDGYANRDNRVRVFHREPNGLTRALICGCEAARGEYIARQDCGDRSLGGRLVRQLALLAECPGAAMAAVGARFVGPRNEALYEISQTSQELRQGLAQTTLQTIRGPSHHGATMFRKNAYEAAGGYRAAFPVAQDLDLWLRLAELGEIVAIRDVLYEARLSSNSISQLRRDEQFRATQVILDCAASRRRGEGDGPRLAAWMSDCVRRPESSAVDQRRSEARFHRFLGNMLREKDPAQAREYYVQSLRSFLWQPAVWLRLLALDASR
jgi:glycosyltransferase involved in cell wall biosynthesis